MFPVMLDLCGRRCLVVGGGGVALRKVQNLIDDEAEVTVVAKTAVPQIGRLAAAGRLVLEKREYLDGEAAGFALVFAATNDASVNRRVAQDAERAGVWCNVADDPDLCSFHTPARVRRGPLQLAIGSSGGAPFVIRRLRQVLERRFGQEWSEWVEAATRFRRAVQQLGLDRSRREALYDRFFTETVDSRALAARVPVAEEERLWLTTEADDSGGAQPRPLSREEQAQPPKASGFVSLVGSGPGCPGLLTVRGRQRLMAADTVVYDRLAAAALPCDLRAEVELHAVGKTAGVHPVPQGEINALLVRLARQGKRVVRLKGGDPYVFGRGGEEAEVLAAEGIPFEVVPGVTSGIAAPGWIGVPVTHRREVVRLTLLTAHEAIKQDGPQVRWDLIAQDPHNTLVGYMGVTALPKVVETLLEHGMDPEMPAAMVEQGTTAAQRHVISTLIRLPEAVAQAGLKPPALFVIGPTIRHADHLGWFARLPLAGQRLLVSAASCDLIEVLETAGADVVALPSPVTEAARIVMAALPLTGCIVGSPDEAQWLDEERDNPGFNGATTAWCLGTETAASARNLGWQRVKTLDGATTAGRLVDSIAVAAQGCPE